MPFLEEREHTSAFRLVAEAEALQSADPRAAARTFHAAAEAARCLDNPSLCVGALEREVTAWAAAGETERVRETADLALALVSDVDDSVTRVALLSNIAIALGAAGFDEQSIDLLVEARAELHASPAPDPETDAKILLNIAVTETQRGRAEVAMRHLAEAAAEIERTPNDRLLATIRLNEAVACSAADDPRAARIAYLDALRLYTASGAPDADVAAAMRGQAATLSRLGRYREALDLYKQTISLFEHAGRPDEVFRTSIGELAARFSLGMPITTAELDEIEQQLAGRSLDVVGEMSRNVANVRLRAGDLDGAERAYVRARRAFRRIGRAGDVASVDGNRALAARDRGDLERARRLMGLARREQARLGRWLSVANADVNLAALLQLIASQSNPPRTSLLRAALRRAMQAADAIDRYRHLLGTAADRAAVMQHVYKGLFPMGLQLALRCGSLPTVASLVERARVQPVLADPDASDRPYRPPMSVEAVAGRRMEGSTAVIADEAVRLAGEGARWLGWWSNGDIIIGSVTGRRGVTVAVRTVEDELRTLAAALPVPLESERAAAPDEDTAQRACLYRTLRGPLVGNTQLAAAVGETLPSPAKAAAEEAGGLDVCRLDDAELLWPLARMLLPADLLDELRAAAVDGQRIALVVAPPPELGRVPWAALPLADPADTEAVARLIEAANVTVALPISLSVSHGRRAARPSRTGPPLVVADPLGDLRYLRCLYVPGARRLGADGSAATRDAMLAAAAEAPMLVLGAHVRPGTEADPAESAILLRGPDGNADPLTVATLAHANVPPTCVLFTCDGAGAATGAEWTGVATGLVWGGADWVVATISPTIEDRAAAVADQQLLDAIWQHGPTEGLWNWQRHLAAARRRVPSHHNAPLRWAMTVVTGSPPGA